MIAMTQLERETPLHIHDARTFRNASSSSCSASSSSASSSSSCVPYALCGARRPDHAPQNRWERLLDEGVLVELLDEKRQLQRIGTVTISPHVISKLSLTQEEATFEVPCHVCGAWCKRSQTGRVQSCINILLLSVFFSRARLKVHLEHPNPRHLSPRPPPPRRSDKTPAN